MTNQLEPADAIKQAEEYEALKRAVMRLLDDPQVQQKMLRLLQGQPPARQEIAQTGRSLRPVQGPLARLPTG